MSARAGDSMLITPAVDLPGVTASSPGCADGSSLPGASANFSLPVPVLQSVTDVQQEAGRGHAIEGPVVID